MDSIGVPVVVLGRSVEARHPFKGVRLILGLVRWPFALGFRGIDSMVL